MRSKRLTALLLALLVTVFTLVPIFSVNADESPEVNFNGLNAIQKRFLRVVGSYARASYYETDVLASLMLSQGIYESGWGRSSLAVGGRNLFGIKAFSTWDGMVYDQKNSILYDSYEDYLFASGQTHVNTTSAWRAHNSWKESADSHSALLGYESRYSALVSEKSYSVAAKALVTSGYCADNGYAEMVVKLIETYGLTAYDDLTPDENGIVALTADEETVFLDIGATHQTSITFYPPLPEKTPDESADASVDASADTPADSSTTEEASDTSLTSDASDDLTSSNTSDESSEPDEAILTWASDNTKVATVDQNGLVTGVGHGTALITASLSNGREACVIVNVDCNATVKSNNIAVRTEPSVTSSSKGTILSGTAVYVPDTTLYTDASGNVYIAVRGITNTGITVSGYAFANDVYLNRRAVTAISAVTDKVTLTVGETYTPKTVVSPADAADRTLTWSSGDSTVASVSESGTVTANKLGETVITATAVGGTSLNITVTVASAKSTQTAYISAYKSVTVRTGASDSSSRSGYLYYKDKVTVTGAPNGKFYYVSGTNANGSTVKGYVNASYVRLVEDGFTVTEATATASLPIYQRATDSSRLFATLSKGTSYMILGVSGKWSYIMALYGSTAVHGYADLTLQPAPDDGSDDPSDDTSGDTSGGGDTSAPTVTETTYTGTLARAKTGTKLNIRSGAGTSYPSVAQVSNGTELLILSTENSWHKVLVKVDGEYTVGYCHTDYATHLYSAKTTSNMNLRSTASTSGSVVKVIPNGASFVVVGEISNEWYSVEYTSDGTVYKGYCKSGSYLTVSGKLPSSVTVRTETPPADDTSGSPGVGDDTPPEDEDNGFSCTNPDYAINDGVLTGLGFNVKAHEFLDSFTGDVKIYSSAGLELGSGDSVGTGCVLRVSEDGVMLDVATVLLMGDVNGDGLLSSLDYLQVKRHCFKTLTLKDVFLSAALLSGENAVSAADYTLARRAVLGTYKIVQ